MGKVIRISIVAIWVAITIILVHRYNIEAGAIEKTITLSGKDLSFDVFVNYKIKIDQEIIGKVASDQYFLLKNQDGEKIDGEFFVELDKYGNFFINREAKFTKGLWNVVAGSTSFTLPITIHFNSNTGVTVNIEKSQKGIDSEKDSIGILYFLFWFVSFLGAFVFFGLTFLPALPPTKQLKYKI